MGRSNTYTVKTFWNAATREIPEYDQNSLIYNERFNLINMAQETTQSLVSDAVSEAYLDDFLVGIPATDKQLSSGGSYAFATRTLTATMDHDFSSDDVGSTVTFTYGSNNYLGIIQAYVSATSVILRQGYGNLPTTNLTPLETVLLQPTTLTYSVLSISSFRMLRYGAQVKMQIASSATSSVFVLSPEKFERWRESAAQNRNTIVWTLSGTNLYLKKGSSLANYGTITLRFPTLPSVLVSDTENIDLLDGAMAQIGIMVLKNIIQKRLSLKSTVSTEEILQQVQSVYRSQGGEAKKEEIISKIESLL